MDDFCSQSSVSRVNLNTAPYFSGVGISGAVVECLPSTWASRVRFPAAAQFFSRLSLQIPSSQRVCIPLIGLEFGATRSNTVVARRVTIMLTAATPSYYRFIQFNARFLLQ